MSITPSPSGDLTLHHVLDAAGVELSDVVILRHTYTPNGLATPADVTPRKLLEYVQRQEVGNKLGRTPPSIWLNFMADGGRRCRFLTAYENHGEVPEKQVGNLRYFDLNHSEILSSLKNRLAIEWSKDTVNWAKQADRSDFPVVEIADPRSVEFPGFDQVLVTHHDLRAVIEEARYASWRVALGSVQGIYLIADTSTGKLYVGKADGAERILGRWSAYARDGHGGNAALRELMDVDNKHGQHFKFSILRVFGPSVPTAEVDQAEAHFKRALLSREFGLNRN